MFHFLKSHKQQYCILLSLLVLSAVIAAQDLTNLVGNYNIKHYDIEDGLRQMQINDIYISSKKEVWLGTRSGVSLFNGSKFDNFEDLRNKPLYVADIGELSDGTIVFLSNRSLYFYDGLSFTEKIISHDSRYTFQAEIFVDAQDHIWIKNKYDLESAVLFCDNTFTNLSDTIADIVDPHTNWIVPINNDSILKTSDWSKVSLHNVNSDHEEIIYESSLKFRHLTSSNTYQYDNDKRLSSILLHEVLPDNQSQIIKISINPTHIDTIVRIDEEGKNHAYHGSDAQLIYNVTPDIFTIENNKLKYVIKDYMTPYNGLLSMATDVGKIYLGTDKGLVVISDSDFNNYDEDVFDYVWTITETQDSQIVLCSYKGGLRYLDNPNLIRLSLEDNVSAKDRNYIQKAGQHYYFSSVTDVSGALYLPSHKGIHKLSGEELSYFYPKENYSSVGPTLYNLYDTERELFFRGTCPGIEIIDKNADVIRKIDSRLFSHNCVLTICQTKSDEYWIGATGGIAKYDYTKDSITNYTYSSDSISQFAIISSLVDYNDNLWIGGKGGLSYYDKANDSFLLVEALRNYEINSIIQTEPDKYFLATVRGLLMVDLQAYLDGKPIRSRLFTSQDGMNGLELGQNGLFQDSRGDVWTTSSTHIVKFNPESLEYHNPKIIPVVNNVNDIRIPYDKRPIIIPDQNNDVIITYGLHMTPNTHDINYRHRLNDKEWSKWTKNTIIRFSKLSSGKHSFELEARNVLNPTLTSEIEKISFRIDIPFYKDPIFNAAVIAIAGLLFLLTLLLIRNQELKKRLVDLLKEEKDQLIFEKEELLLLNNELKDKVDKSKITKPSQGNAYIEVKSTDKIHRCLLSNIKYILAEDNGIRIYTIEKSIWSAVSLKNFLDGIEDENIIRIFRSSAININYVKWVNHTSLMMNDDTELKIGRTYKENISKSFQK